MPRVVDREARRAEAVDALLDLIADEGIAAATSRSLAHRLGMSNGALWRYFRDKDHLLSTAYRTVVERTNLRAEAALEGLDGVRAVQTLVTQLLPLDKTSQKEARVVVNFWGSAATNASASSGLGRPELAEWGARITTLLLAAIDAGELRTDTPVPVVATMLLSYTVSAQVEFVFQGRDAHPDISRPVSDLLDAFRA